MAKLLVVLAAAVAALCWAAAADASVYWANLTGNTIGRANLDGTGVNQNFITQASAPAGVAVDSRHLYWSNLGSVTASNTISKANLNGTDVNQNFITGANSPEGVGLPVVTEQERTLSGLAELA